MLLTTCTAFTEPPQRCGARDLCTLVRTLVPSPAGGPMTVEHEHRVCAVHREHMSLPPYDVAVTPFGVVPIDDDGTIPSAAWTTADGVSFDDLLPGPNELRLPAAEPAEFRLSEPWEQ